MFVVWVYVHVCLGVCVCVCVCDEMSVSLCLMLWALMRWGTMNNLFLLLVVVVTNWGHGFTIRKRGGFSLLVCCNKWGDLSSKDHGNNFTRRGGLLPGVHGNQEGHLS